MQKSRLLCIQPTGYGKSLLYQLPSCLLGGVTLVISPLLALMRDQIDQLTNRFQIVACSINSDQAEEENESAIRRVVSGEAQILFTSPEQLDHIDRFEFLLGLPITLLVIDEAHCISTWGHDFRPSYRHILQFSEALQRRQSKVKILGLTATADERVEKDIVRQLSSQGEAVHVLREAMDRPNIHLSVLPAHGIAAKLELCLKLLSSLSGHGLIYSSTRENAELVAEYLQREGQSIIAYHAGLESEEKRRIQKDFAQNTYRAISATTALGMGIDKKDLRFVIHFDIPGSITAYYQEVGRAGRDGLRAEGVLLYDRADRAVQDYFIDAALPLESDFQMVLKVVREAEAPPNLTYIKRITGLHPTRVTIVLAELLDQKFLKKESLKGSQVYKIDNESRSLDLSRYTTQHLVKSQELEKMIAYAEGRAECRMKILRSSLGDPESVACTRCDVCQKRAPLEITDARKTLEWLSLRPVPIAAAKTHNISEGLSLFDSKLRSPLFVRFMRERKEREEVDSEILSLLFNLASHFSVLIGAIVSLPSTTWKARASFAKALAEHLKVPLFSDLLTWETLPEKRQGELLNNDQRHHNVHGKMGVKKCALPEGVLILFDDYIGSGSTMKEAARALRKMVDNPLIPFTIASVKWRLGKPGFV